MRQILRWESSLWIVQALLGVACGIFVASLVLFDAAVWRPLRVPDLERIQTVGGLGRHPSLGDPATWWAQVKSADHLAYYRTGDANVRLLTMDRVARVTEVSSQFDDVFQVAHVRGRGCAARDVEIHADVAVVSEPFWNEIRGYQAADTWPVLVVNGRSFTVVGVVPESFRFPSSTEVWICGTADVSALVELSTPDSGRPTIRTREGWIARLADGAQPRQAEDELTARVALTNERISPKSGIRYGQIVRVEPLSTSLAKRARPDLLAFLVSCASLLVLSMLNSVCYFSLLAAKRSGELHLRLALGASRWQAASPLAARAVVSGLFCGLVGGAVGLPFVAAAAHVMAAHAVIIEPASHYLVPMLVLSAVLGATTSSLAFAIVVILMRTSSVAQRLRSQVPGTMTGRRGVSAVSIVLQLAVATVLLVNAQAFYSAFRGRADAERGYSPDSVAVTRVTGNQLKSRPELAGGGPVAMANALPILAKDRGYRSVQVSGAHIMAAVVAINGDYFQVLNVGLIAGHGRPGKNEVVINQTFAEKAWPGRTPIGDILRFDGEPGELIVVGVVTSVRALDEAAAPPEVYLSLGDRPPGTDEAKQIWILSSTADARRLLQALGIARDEDVRIEALDDLLERELAPDRALASVWSLYAVTGIVSAICGVAVLVAFTARARRHDLAIRSALGATPARIAAELGTEGVVQSAAGASLGLVLSVASIAIARHYLAPFATPTMLQLWAAASGMFLLGVCAALATTIRSARQNPAASLRSPA